MEKIFLLWGWVDQSNYKNYEDYLQKQDYNPYEVFTKWWKDNLQTDLWENFEVIKIPMPNKGFAYYEYWKVMFEKALPYFGEKNILLGHSLWGSFLLKYLNENEIQQNISQIHLVAPAVLDSDTELLGSFHFEKSLENYKNFENITNFYFSKDDEIVTFENYEHLQKVLPNAQFHIFKNMWHFIFQEHFEELVENISW